MPIKDIFDKPFDEGTIAKLEIFEKILDDKEFGVLVQKLMMKKVYNKINKTE